MSAREPDDKPDADVPRLPRGRGLRLSRPQLVRIAGTLVLLIFVVVAQRPCADSVSKLVTGFGDNGTGSAALPRPGTIDVPSGSSAGSADPLGGYEQLRPNMTDEELKAAIDRARIKAHAGSAPSNAGSASGSAGSAAPR